jgi:bis(5'-nucleosyl)-tetraphosphatase (symmetrical)
MATYAVGDVQGCMATLDRLLRHISFGRGDRLWLVGDLVNRGPHNREVLQFAKKQEARCQVVLGNHDLHLIARWAGVVEPKRRDTLDDVLDARDADELVSWLRRQPIVHREGSWLMVHAGLPPSWTVADAQKRARKLQEALREGRLKALTGEGRMAEHLRLLTRLRMLDRKGQMADFDGPPDEAPKGLVPWFAHPERRSRDVTVVFGHWSALGLHVEPSAVGLDTGCVWGRALTAMRLDDRRVFSEPAVERRSE